MRILNGLKYTLVDQFKVLLISIASVFGVVMLFSLLATKGRGISIAPEFLTIFVWIGFLILIFMGFSYTPIYFRTLIQGGFTRLEIFLTQIITDIIIVISGCVLCLFSLFFTAPTEVAYAYKTATYVFNPFIMLLLILLGFFGSRTLFNCLGLIANKFSNKFAGIIIVFVSYYGAGVLLSSFDISPTADFIVDYGIYFSLIYVAALLCAQYFIMKTHNSKPITK
ncbi:hypothetical protein J7S27_06625 [Carnobacteriaceae bacterium zg-C25]|nr:hypothetical protein J7S27_06625 [Carnobacteriaceae bacterium zg-C25]